MQQTRQSDSLDFIALIDFRPQPHGDESPHTGPAEGMEFRPWMKGLGQTGQTSFFVFRSAASSSAIPRLSCIVHRATGDHHVAEGADSVDFPDGIRCRRSEVQFVNWPPIANPAVRRWEAHQFQSVPRSTGNFNLDGDIGFEDFLALPANFAFAFHP